MFSKIKILAWILLTGVATAASAVDIQQSFNIENGTMISDENGNLIWYGGGIVDPTIFPGVDAPLGSSYRQTNGTIWAKIGVGPLDWVQEGLGSAVFTQTASFGQSGNAVSGSFLSRAGNVSSNISGIPILVGTGVVKSIACGQENISTYTVEYYEHEGDFTNPILLGSLTVTSARTGVLDNLNVAVTKGKQLAIKTLSAVKNVGCTIAMKGLSL